MAPRRGGGSGGIDVGPVQNRCSFSDTIGTTTVVARLAIDGTALAFLLVIPWLWFAARRKNPNLKRLLPWHTFGILMVMDSMFDFPSFLILMD
jgi:ABC-type phosphate/phosphonate transport system permease subunit